MASNDCKDEIEASIGRAMTAGERKVILRNAAKVKARIDAAGGGPAVAQKMLTDFVAERAEIKAAKQMQAAQREVVRQQLDTRQADAGDFAIKAPGEYLKSLVVSSLKQFKGAADSLGHRITRGQDQRSMRFFNSLGAKGLTEYAFNPADQENIWKAYAALNEGKDPAQFGPRAVEAATVLKKNADILYSEKLEAGIPVGKRKDWYGPQIHDPNVLARAGGNKYGSDASAAAWVKDIMPRIDWSESMSGQFAAADDSLRAKRMTELWSQFVSHNHLKYGTFDPTKGREIVFKSAKDAFDYNKTYGNGRSLAENIHSHILGGARDIEVNKLFGNAPENMFNQHAEALAKKINEDESIPVSKRATAIKQLETAQRKAKEYYFPALLDGLADPEHGAMAQVIGAAQAATNGIAVAAAAPVLLGDFPLAQNQFVRFGGRGLQGYLGQTGKLISRMSAFTKEERMRAAAAMEIVMQDATQPLTHAHMDSTVPGAIHRMNSTLMKYSAHTPWTDRALAGLTTMFAEDHWQDRTRAFTDLLPGQQNGFERFGIGAKEWDVIRNSPVMDVNSSVKAFSPRGVRGMDLENFKTLADPGASDATLRRIRTDVADKYRNFLGEMANRAVSAPDAEMKAITLHGTRAGTGVGTVVRMFNSLKSWTYNQMRNHYGQMIAGDANPDNVGWGKMMWAFARGQGGDLGGRSRMSKFIANNMLYGAAIAELSLIRSGKEPIVPDTPEKAAQLAVLGFTRQGLGLYSDLLMDQMERPDQSIYETIGKSFAPAVTDAADLAEASIRVANASAQAAGNSEYSGDKFWKAFRKSAGQAGRVGTSLIPTFAYTKFATDFYIKDNLLDAINPGYKDRLMKRAKDEGTPFMLPK